jgi:hypothetical protein
MVDLKVIKVRTFLQKLINKLNDDKKNCYTLLLLKAKVELNKTNGISS